MFELSAGGIAGICGTAVFLLTMTAGALLDSRKSRRWDNGKENSREWLFSHFDKGIYKLFYGKREPRDALKGMKQDLDAYERNCKIIRKDPQYERLAIWRATTVLLALVSAAAFLLTRNPAFPLLGLAGALYLFKSIPYQAKTKAQRQKTQLKNELPRFLDLLETALQIGIPVETAIGLVAERVPGILSMELAGTNADVELGTNNWIASLERLASDYGVDDFSDLVLDLATSYSKGVPVLEAVRRKNAEIQTNSINQMKARATKLSSSILIPVTVLEILPMIVVMMLPMIGQLMNF